MRRLSRGLPKAFTLVELLIVISIITILAGLLLPVFGRARDRARQAACSSNERQLALAVMQYTQDWDEAFPSGLKAETGQGWAGQIFSLVKSPEVFRCPQDPGNRSPDDEDDDLAGYRVSYGLNCNLSGTIQAQLLAPASTVMVFEVNDASAELTDKEWRSPTGRGLPMDSAPKIGKPFGADYYATGNLGGIAPTLSTTKRPYHDPRSNFLAADGHVKALLGGMVSPGRDAPDPEAAQDCMRFTAAGTMSMRTPGGLSSMTFSKQ